MSEQTVNILGVGNPLMGDDGIGPAAIDEGCQHLCSAFDQQVSPLSPAKLRQQRVQVHPVIVAGGQGQNLDAFAGQRLGHLLAPG